MLVLCLKKVLVVNKALVDWQSLAIKLPIDGPKTLFFFSNWKIKNFGNILGNWATLWLFVFINQTSKLWLVGTYISFTKKKQLKKTS